MSAMTTAAAAIPFVSVGAATFVVETAGVLNAGDR